MKKLLIVAAAVSITSFSAFSQGVVLFGASLHNLYNNTTQTGTYTTSTALDVALLFAPATASPTGGFPTANSQTTGSWNYSTATIWSQLLTDTSGPWFWVINNASSTIAVGTGTANGTISYNTGVSFTAANVSSGVLYDVYEVAWAASAGSSPIGLPTSTYVGWSQMFTYTPNSVGGTGPTMSGMGSYGVGGTPVAAPEPGTMALAALGGASLLMFRRKK